MFRSKFLKRDWFRPRGYLHFDPRVSRDDRRSIYAFVANPKRVARHAFHPFLLYKKKKSKVVEENGRPRRYVEGTRTICYAAHTDAQIYAYYGSCLSEIYERLLEQHGLSENVIAFRRLVDIERNESKSNIHLAHDAFQAIAKMGDCQVFAFDVKKFFDSLNRRTLKSQWCSVLGVEELPPDHYAIFKSVTKFKYVNRDEAFERFGISKNGDNRNRATLCKREELNAAARGTNFVKVMPDGIPQGSPISACLANIYMLPFDLAIAAAFKKIGGKYYRYCDDVLCILPKGCDLDVQELVESELNKIFLRLNHDKTDIATFEVQNGVLKANKPIQYLGFIFDGRLDKISIRPGSISLYKRKVKKAVDLAIATAIKQNRARTLDGKKPQPVYMKNLYRRHSHIGKRNFISYAKIALDVTKSKTIRIQLLRFQRFFDAEIARAKNFNRLNFGQETRNVIEPSDDKPSEIPLFPHFISSIDGEVPLD